MSEQNKIEELLKPRYRLIADYPGNTEKVGYIYEQDMNGHFWDSDGSDYESEKTLQKYPHLFKKLEWWEDRQESEMPEYVKRIDGSEVFERVFRYEGGGSVMVKFPKGIYRNGTVGPIGLLNVLPATKEEFDNQKINQ